MIRCVTAAEECLNRRETSTESTESRRREIHPGGCRISRKIDRVGTSAAIQTAGECRGVAELERIIVGSADQGPELREDHSRDIPRVRAGDVVNRSRSGAGEGIRSTPAVDPLNIRESSTHSRDGRGSEIQGNRGGRGRFVDGVEAGPTID